ncbi:MAG TPA: hypothetical protein VIV66_00365, partial [Pyrinomonadaceae bacterium]
VPSLLLGTFAVFPSIAADAAISLEFVAIVCGKVKFHSHRGFSPVKNALHESIAAGVRVVSACGEEFLGGACAPG